MSNSNNDLPPSHGRLTAESFEVDGIEFAAFRFDFSFRAHSALTSAENAIAELVCLGLRTAQIAFLRNSSYRTVANQLASVYEKLSIHSRHELIAVLSRRNPA